MEVQEEAEETSQTHHGTLLALPTAESPRPRKIESIADLLQNPRPRRVSISTPRSREAFKRQGILPTEIVYKAREEFRREAKAERATPEVYQLRYEHYEAKRQEKIAALLRVSPGE